MRRCLLVLALLAVCVLLMGGLDSVTADPPEGVALVWVAGGSRDELLQAEELPIEVYARLTGTSGPYLLVGASPDTVEALRSLGLEVAVLDGDVRGASYYLAFPSPRQPLPDWEAYGHPLLDDGRRVLLRLSDSNVDRLSRTGVTLRALTLEAKPLRSLSGTRSLPADVQAEPLVEAMIDQVSATRVYSYTGDLSGEWPVIIGGEPYTLETRYTEAWTAMEKATQYAYEHLQAQGLDVQYHYWQRLLPYPLVGRNVIGELTGEIHPEDIVILCAHLDSTSGDPFHDAPGADDNASGSVAVLLAAEILSQYRWGCTLRFALWTGEEQGLWGSHYYAQSRPPTEQIAGVLNLDMIGWNTPASPWGIDLHATASLPSTLQLAQVFSDVVGAYDLGLVPEIIPEGTDRSDHASFWDYGYPAILGIEDFGDFNPYYHSVEDRVEHLDLDYYTEFVKASLATLAHMSDCLLSLHRVYLPLVERGPR